MISFWTPKHHWNYFLAIEKNLENLSRYIEFSEENMNTYSIELAYILMSASSETDVIMKELCLLIGSWRRAENINDYREIIKNSLSQFSEEIVCIDRFELTYKSWENWSKKDTINPNWWKSYNNVKHQRNTYFNQANLQNTINAVWALLIATIYYYKLSFSNEDSKYYYKLSFSNEDSNKNDFKETTSKLWLNSFITMNKDYYEEFLTI